MESRIQKKELEMPTVVSIQNLVGEIRAFLSSCMQLTKPGISVFIGLTTVVGMMLRPGQEFGPWYGGIGLFLASYLSSGGSAAFNQFFERDLDREMTRTKTRPLPSGKVSPRFVLIYSISLLTLGLGAAYYFGGLFPALYLGAGAFSYIVLYTVITKRRTSWNVPIGGLCGMFAALAGVSLADGSLTLDGLTLSVLLYLWSAPHFWCLAIVKKEEYKRVGVPMLPVVVGVYRTSVAVLAHVILLVLAAFPFFLNRPLTGVFTLISGLIFLYFSVKLLGVAKRQEDEELIIKLSRKTFFYSLIYLPLIYSGVWLEQLL